MTDSSQQTVSDWRWEKHSGRDVDRQEPQDDKPACNYCNSMRFVVDPKGNLKPCPACGVAQGWRADRMGAYSSNAGKAKTQTFDNFRTPTPALKTLRNIFFDYATNPHGWLLVYGQPGNGKSHLCAAVYNEVQRRGVDCIFVTMPDLIASLKSLFDEATRNEEHETYQHRLQMYQQCAVLVVDDLGAERSTEWTEGVLFELLDYRYRNELATVLSTNQDPRDAGNFDERLISRWHDSKFSMVLRNTSPDYRQTKTDAAHRPANGAKETAQ